MNHVNTCNLKAYFLLFRKQDHLRINCFIDLSFVSLAQQRTYFIENVILNDSFRNYSSKITAKTYIYVKIVYICEIGDLMLVLNTIMEIKPHNIICICMK